MRLYSKRTIKSGAPDRNRACDLQFRKLALDPTELQAHLRKLYCSLSAQYRILILYYAPHINT